MRRSRLVAGGAILVVAVGAGAFVRSRSCTWGTFAYKVPGELDETANVGILRDGETVYVSDDDVTIGAELSPDGSRVVLARGRSFDDGFGFTDLGLFVADVEGGNEERLTEAGGSTLSWAPVGNEVLVVGGLAIRAVDVETKEERTVYRLPPSDAVDPPVLAGGAWSPDASRIAFLVTRTGRQGRLSSELWVVDADGGNPRRLAHVGDDMVYDLAWSPDGETFAWSGHHAVRSLFLMDADELTPEPVEPNAMKPHWSRDGERLAYVIGHEGHYRFRIVVGDERGRDPEQVPGGPLDPQAVGFEDWASC